MLHYNRPALSVKSIFPSSKMFFKETDSGAIPVINGNEPGAKNVWDCAKEWHIHETTLRCSWLATLGHLVEVDLHKPVEETSPDAISNHPNFPSEKMYFGPVEQGAIPLLGGEPDAMNIPEFAQKTALTEEMLRKAWLASYGHLSITAALSSEEIKSLQRPAKNIADSQTDEPNDQKKIDMFFAFEGKARKLVPVLSAESGLSIEDTAKLTGEDINRLASVWLASFSDIIDVDDDLIFKKKLFDEIYHTADIMNHNAKTIGDSWALLIDENEANAELATHMKDRLIQVARELKAFVAKISLV